MSVYVLDDQISELVVPSLAALQIQLRRLRNLRPNELIKDDRVPTLLRELSRPTSVTIDAGFWKRDIRNNRYCVMWFALRHDQQFELAGMLRRALAAKEFKSAAARMGKVARIGATQIDYWETGDDELRTLRA